jgi:cytochrome P450 family 110
VRTVERARAAIRSELEARRREPAANDLAGMLIDARDEAGQALDESAIVDEILTMIVAGHETTAMAATWLCYAVFTRPDVRDRLRAEAREHAALADRPYLAAVVRESLRFHSTVPNGSGRLAKRAFELGKREIPRGALVTVAIHEVHREAGVFERADEFLPERFLDAKYSPYESIPFGGGTRRCLGMPFALQELAVILAGMIDRWDLVVVQREVRPVWRARFLTPSRGLVVRAVTPVAAS